MAAFGESVICSCTIDADLCWAVWTCMHRSCVDKRPINVSLDYSWA